MDYATAVRRAPPGWRHFHAEDIARLPSAVRDHELARIPRGEPDDHVLRALFWTLVYHLEPERWDELAGVEPVDPALIEALPNDVGVAIDVAAGSGRLTHHLRRRARRVIAVEPSLSLGATLMCRMPDVSVVAAWAEALPLPSHVAQLTTACAAFGPDPLVLAELERVTAPGGWIALINPEEPQWFEENGWKRTVFSGVAAQPHAPWIDQFFGPPDPPRELVIRRAR